MNSSCMHVYREMSNETMDSVWNSVKKVVGPHDFNLKS